MCNKIGYDNFDSALKAMQKLNRNAGHDLKRCYICWNCVKWHVTSKELKDGNIG